MATNKIKATVINLEQEVPKSGGSPWLMISEKAAATAMSSERPGLVAGSAQSLVGPKVSAGPAVALAAPATGAAILDTIKGRTFVWNQLIACNDTSKVVNGVTITISDNKITISGTATDSGGRAIKLTPATTKMINGHKYIGVSSLSFGDDEGGLFITSESNTGRTVKIPLDDIITYTGTTFEDGFLGVNVRTNTAYNKTGYLYLVDLTELFLAGYEPATVAEFEALFPESYYANNPGTILPLRISGLVSKDADDAELATLSLPIVGKTAKDADGNAIVPFPEGMHGTPTVYDTATKEGGEVKWGVRAYEAGDESDATVITDGTNTVYPLATPVPFTWDEPLEMVAPVADGGVLSLQPEGVDEQGIPATAPLAADIKWPVNAVSADTLTNLLDALKTAGVITAYTMTWDAAAGAYTFTIS